MRLFGWVDNHHYFDFCTLMERVWRARVAKNPKTARAERSLAEFHRQYPEHVVNLAQWRLQRARRVATEQKRITK
jgi:hypothetical protein